MKSTIIKISLAILMLNTLSCNKQTTTFNDFKFASETPIINCGVENDKLLSEAVLSFENDITNHYDATNKNLSRAYNVFIRDAFAKRVSNTDIVSDHTIKVLNALKNTDIFKDNKLDYNSAVVKCLAQNMNDSGMKTTFNALLSTNSMKKKTFGSPLRSSVMQITKDKYLSTYVALDYFYSELLNIDLNNVKPKEAIKKEDPKIQPLVKPVAKEKDPHAGHNH
ncbi:hypothetical protein [Ichthyenterobacterium magnum]|uniref:Uncharacterized protein n=1 Tax=Ichthyenterobacterium magnum TaxID=1230530 RepID=A0A420DGT2_9FLAO|nr:hypothetical protein [Ichthyenterobacterium magnum]RKE92292.1 hypothetical protein BXY80_2211 [Ichthyenterobacterium magnum]